MQQKTALVTGANKGIGFEIARQLGKKGFYVVISGRDEPRLAAALDKLKAENIAAGMLLLDVGDDAGVARAAAEFAGWNRRLDVLINNAAILRGSDNSLSQGDSALFAETININCHGALRVSKAFLPFLIAPRGRIIMMSSGGGSMTDPVGGWSPAYCVSKSMLNAITRHLANELQGRGIAVNAVCPGWVRTDMGGSSAPRPVERGAQTPVWLATEASEWLTGKFWRDEREIPW